MPPGPSDHGSVDGSSAVPSGNARSRAEAEGAASPHPSPPDRSMANAELSSTLRKLATPDLPPAGRRDLVRRLARQLPRPRPAAPVRWLVDAVSRIAPHIPIRDLATLRAHHRLDGAALADRLLRNAARATAGVGAASGGLASIQWAAPPTLLAAPVLLSAETVAVVAIEMKLLGELHVVYGVPLPDGGARKAWVLAQAWTQQRGINLLLPGSGFTAALRTPLRRELTDRLARRFGRNLPTLAPMLTGAAVAAYLNQRATRALGYRVAADLARIAADPATAAAAAPPPTPPGAGY
jgi:hypothetical protein